MKCHWCHKELQPIPQNTDIYDIMTVANTIQFFECPDVHCEVIYDGITKSIVQYTLFVDHNNKRYKIQGHKGPNQTHFLIKNDRRQFVNALTIKRFLALKPNKETGILEGQAIFKKLKTLQVFS